MSDLTLKLNLWQIRFTATFLVIGAGCLGLFWRQLPPQVPLLYSQTWGTEQLVSPSWLWLLPIINLSLGLASSFCINRFKWDSVLAACWLVSIIAIQSIITLALIRIIILIL